VVLAMTVICPRDPSVTKADIDNEPREETFAYRGEVCREHPEGVRMLDNKQVMRAIGEGIALAAMICGVWGAVVLIAAAAGKL
jgi:hypothetical protein